MYCKISPSISFGILLSITCIYFVVEIIVGFMYNSLVLKADAYHMLTDIISLVVGFVANKVELFYIFLNIYSL